MNLIPISGSLIMCPPVLAFVRKQNKEMEKSKIDSQRKRAKKKGGMFIEVIWQPKAQFNL